MQAVYWDYIRADVYTNEMIRNDSTKIAARENSRLQNEIFALHKISKEDFYKSYDYYLNHPLMLKEMLDTMTVRQQKKIEIQKAIDIKKDSLRMRILKKNADTLKIK
ncbi:MAG: DUF4296 domain-containing protein [Gloeobacteraceae cyanobacterium ES-bin-316]|nr:DUF4296 domain-containing protein [Ferruginibacter sp.]